MEIALTEEQQALKSELRAYYENLLTPEVEQELSLAGGVGPAVRRVVRQMGSDGWLGIGWPTEWGGQGRSAIEQFIFFDESMRSGAPVPMLTINTVGPTIMNFGTQEQKEFFLPQILAGEISFCIGYTEPNSGTDLASLTTRAVRDGEDYVINGSKTYITNGHRADVIVLVTKTDVDAGYDGFTLFLVPMDAPGVIREKKLVKLGMHASDTALLAFQDVRVPASAVLGGVGKGFYHIMWELQGERLIGAAGNVAGAQKCFERTLQYAHERKAFGREIGKFQVIRHKFAEMATKIESARQMVYVTAWRFNNGEYPVREISMAKLHAARVGCEVADECIQIHGGAGYMREYGVERSWRDMRLARIGAGTDEIMLDVIGRSYGL